MVCMLPCVRFVCFVRSGLRNSAANATLGTGEWLALTRQGLSPCKNHRASWRTIRYLIRRCGWVWIPALQSSWRQLLRAPDNKRLGRPGSLRGRISNDLGSVHMPAWIIFTRAPLIDAISTHKIDILNHCFARICFRFRFNLSFYYFLTDHHSPTNCISAINSVLNFLYTSVLHKSINFRTSSARAWPRFTI